MDNKKYHELYFMNRVEFENEEDKKIEYTMKNIEGKDYLQYEWLDIDKLEEYNILPKCIKQILSISKDDVQIVVTDNNDQPASGTLSVTINE